ncbi:hypothetical protein F5876DRAFT_84135, partial [Lentinula aff. lateritia]
LKEKRKAEEAAKKKAEEEAARQAAEEKKAREEAAARAVQARRLEEEAAEKRRRVAAAAAARGRQGPAPSEATTSQRRMEVEIPRLIKKGSSKQGAEARDPDDGDDGSDGGDNEDNEDEKAPCERCQIKKIPCLQQEGKRTTVICKPCHDSKVRCSYSGRPVASKQREGGSGERLAVMESQLAQGLADVRTLREATTRTNQYLWQILRRQDEVNSRLIAIETRLSMAGLATPGPSRTVSVKPRVLKRRRVEEETEEEQEEEEEEKEEKEKEGGEDKEEGDEPAPKKARSEKGKEREEM